MFGRFGVVPCVAQCTKAGVPAKKIITLQHWHNLGVLPATLTPRPLLAGQGERELLKAIEQLRPQPGHDVHLEEVIPFRGNVAGRVRMGHVLFAECGAVKVMCKEQRLGASFDVVVKELHVGDTLHCRGYPGYEYKGDPAIFATEIVAIERGCPGLSLWQDSVLSSPQNILLSPHFERVHCQHPAMLRFRDDTVLLIEKPAGKLAWEDSRHRHERGTALKVDADPLRNV